MNHCYGTPGQKIPLEPSMKSQHQRMLERIQRVGPHPSTSCLPSTSKCTDEVHFPWDAAGVWPCRGLPCKGDLASLLEPKSLATPGLSWTLTRGTPRGSGLVSANRAQLLGIWQTHSSGKPAGAERRQNHLESSDPQSSLP